MQRREEAFAVFDRGTRELLDLRRRLKRRHKQDPDLFEWWVEETRRRFQDLKVQYMILMDELLHSDLLNHEWCEEFLAWITKVFKNGEFEKLIQMTETTEHTISRGRAKIDSLPEYVRAEARAHNDKWSSRNRLLRDEIRDFKSKVEWFLPQALTFRSSRP
jgi:hypothetical protein